MCVSSFHFLRFWKFRWPEKFSIKQTLPHGTKILVSRTETAFSLLNSHIVDFKIDFLDDKKKFTFFLLTSPVNRCNVEGTVSRHSLEGVVRRCSAEEAVRRCNAEGTVRRCSNYMS